MVPFFRSSSVPSALSLSLSRLFLVSPSLFLPFSSSPLFAFCLSPSLSPPILSSFVLSFPPFLLFGQFFLFSLASTLPFLSFFLLPFNRGTVNQGDPHDGGVARPRRENLEVSHACPSAPDARRDQLKLPLPLLLFFFSEQED